MFSQAELKRIFSWQPYRSDWKCDMNDYAYPVVKGLFKDIINDIQSNDLFSSFISFDCSDGMTNYLEWFCYPNKNSTYSGNAIQVRVSLCAPLVVYGQTTFSLMNDSNGWNDIEVKDIGEVFDFRLIRIQKELLKIFAKHELLILTKEFASIALPSEIAASVKQSNHGSENYFHGLFQYID